MFHLQFLEHLAARLLVVFLSIFFSVNAVAANEAVSCVQSELSARDYRPGPVDGLMGRKTITAANMFAEDAGLDLEALSKETAGLWCDAIKGAGDVRRVISRPDQTARFRDVRWNGADPTLEDGVLTFSLMPRQCGEQTYGDGRGESDCNGGRVRSQVRSPASVNVGQEVEYYMEFFIPEDFSYYGDQWYPSRSRLLITEWKRDEGVKNHIYEMLLDNVRGATFEQATCITREDYGKWNSFSLRIKWSKGSDGYLVAKCNNEIILERRGDQTVIPPNCASDYKLQCNPNTQRPNASIQWNVGPNFSGYGRNYASIGKSSPFAPFPPQGIEIRVRNLYVGKIP